LYETGNAQIVASLFSIISIWFYSYIIGKKGIYWLWYGVFFSICVIVKVDLWFQIFFIILFFTILILLRRTNWSNGIYFIIGTIPGLTLKIINDYIKYGTFHIGELGTFNPDTSYFVQQLFSSYHGFFYTSPIFFICLGGFILLIIYLLKNIRTLNTMNLKEYFLFSLSIYLIIKMFIVSKDYAWGGGTPGARILLTEFPVFVILYAYFLNRQKKIFSIIFGITSLICVIWNLMVISEYTAGLDLKYIIAPPGLVDRVRILKYMISPLFMAKSLDLKMKLCFPILIFIIISIYYIIRNGRCSYDQFGNSKNQKIPKNLIILTIYLIVTYTGITFLNIYDNKRNVIKLKQQGFFKNVEVLKPKEFEKMENVGSMDEMIKYFTLKKNFKKVEEIKKYKKDLYGEM